MGSAEVPPISRIPSMGNHGMSMDFRNKTADLRVTVRHLSRPHHLDAVLLSLTSYGPLVSDRNCAFTDCSRECVQRGAQITGPSPHHRILVISLLGQPKGPVPIRSGTQRLVVMARGASSKGTGDPQGSPAPSPWVWRAVSRTP